MYCIEKFVDVIKEIMCGFKEIIEKQTYQNMEIWKCYFSFVKNFIMMLIFIYQKVFESLE